MTQLSAGSMAIASHYSPTQNNGKIVSEQDLVSGETVTYTYDSLNRLASATSSVNPGWGQAFGYDGFGNLTQQTVTKGTAPSMSVSYDAATNRRTGECADLNGNLCGPQGTPYYYDVENRLSSVTVAGAPNSAAYSYAPGNKRVWRGTWDGEGQVVADEVTFWGVDGQKLRTYQLSKYTYPQNTQPPELSAQATGTYEYFGGKLIKNATGYVTPDRLGSIGKYFPYGQERPSATADGKEKFATYFRDSETGLDYAENRYYTPGQGRFLTVDPYGDNWDVADPGSWNTYAYVTGDPVNFTDPTGLITCGELGFKPAGTDVSVAAVLNAPGDFALFAGVVWAEADPTASLMLTDTFYNERAAIAVSILNRYRILNGTITIAGVNPRFLGWGPVNATVGQVLGQTGQYATVSGGTSSPRLATTFRNRMNGVLGQDQAGGTIRLDLDTGPTYVTPECYNLVGSLAIAYAAWQGQVADPFAAKGYTTSFHHGNNTTALEAYFGDFDTPNNFFGIPYPSPPAPPGPVIRTERPTIPTPSPGRRRRNEEMQ